MAKGAEEGPETAEKHMRFMGFSVVSEKAAGDI